MPVPIVQSEHDEFIGRDMLTIAGAESVLLPRVPHFAPLQLAQFNTAPFGFLSGRFSFEQNRVVLIGPACYSVLQVALLTLSRKK